jgi:hypothetical protein
MTHTTDLTIVSGSLVDDLTPTRRSAQQLRNTLRLNAVTSSLGGVIAAAAAGRCRTGSARGTRSGIE